jgi:tubulin epsilon
LDIGKKKKGNHFEKENAIVANVINNLTCSMRYEGDLNVDLNEITMNLVPFPK